jgi:hypothetical protein
LRAYEAMLVEHVGGKPSPVQGELIRRCARVALHLELADEKAFAGSAMSDPAARQYSIWSGSLVRTLRHLGLQGAPEPVPTLAEILAQPAPSRPTQPGETQPGNDNAGAPDAPSAAAGAAEAVAA